MADQRYVARELTHFIGFDIVQRQRAGEIDEIDSLEEQYQRLKKILNDGHLLSNVEAIVGPVISDPPREWGAAISWGPDLPLAEMVKIGVVCFCDIPVGDLGIHIDKYGPFGLAFGREWLVGRGANPVFYVAEGSVVVGQSFEHETRGSAFKEALEKYMELMESFKVERDYEKARTMQFILTHFVGFMKPFTTGLEVDDERNFYMEREWRLFGDLPFRLASIDRILLPKSYGARFRADFPDFAGEVTFTDRH